jgi:pimeloyl-ACP methyl ester carboxylesterase
VEFLEHRGGRVRLLRGGPADADGAVPDGAVPLVLVHGGGPDHAGISWSPVFAELARDRAVLAFDLPGSGATTGLTIDGRPAALADLAAAVATATGVPRAVWIGVSMGGDVVLNVALRHPGAVAGLVLVAPGGLVERAGSRVLHPLTWLVSRLPDPVLRPLIRFANRFTGAALRVLVHDPAAVPALLRDEVVREARRPDTALGHLRYNRAVLGRGGCATT